MEFWNSSSKATPPLTLEKLKELKKVVDAIGPSPCGPVDFTVEFPFGTKQTFTGKYVLWPEPGIALDDGQPLGLLRWAIDRANDGEAD